MQNDKRRIGGRLSAILGLACMLWLAGPLLSAGSEAADTNSIPVSKAKPAPRGKREAAAKKPAVTHTLSGAELYSIHCNRCHPERYPTERTAAQWKTIMLHMRVRANLPGEQARTILKYLQDNSGR